MNFHITDTLTSDRAYRPIIHATKQDDGSVIIRAGRVWVRFDAADLQQLYAYAADRPHIQRFSIAPKSPQTAE